MNVLVMYDRETETLWSQILGEGIAGPLRGVKLNFEPAIMTTWSDWKSQYPDTLALKKGYYGALDPYDSYYDSNRSGVIGETLSDDRLYQKEFVIGVAEGDESVAFPFSILNAEPVVNYSLNKMPIVVVFNPDSAAGLVYSRDIDGQTLTFEAGSDFTLIDQETDTVWNAYTGEAIQGDLIGSALTPVKSTASFWFGWKDFHPDTFVYGVD